jgi:hypothetical protein
MHRSLAAASCLLALAACTRLFPGVGGATDAGAPEASAPLSAADAGPPLTPLWSDRTLQITEVAGAEARFDVDDSSYELRFKGFPAGTVLVVDGRTTTMGADTTEHVDIAELLSRLNPTKVLEDGAPVDPRLAFELRVPGFAPFKAAAPPRPARFDLVRMMAKAVDHAVLFPREAATDPPLAVHSILFVPASSRRATVFGPAATIREIDWIAVAQELPARKAGTCKFAPDAPGGSPIYAKHHLVDEEVTIVERKTSNVIEKKTFTATTDCPTSEYEGVATSSPDEAEIKRWLRDARSR